MRIKVMSEGGLGNQLFQASFAHYLSQGIPNCEIFFVNDNSNSDRTFFLNNFFQNCSHVQESKSRLQFGRNRHELNLSLTRKFPFFKDKRYSRRLIKENDTTSDFMLYFNQLVVSSHPKEFLIRGYFQNWTYHFMSSECFLSCLRDALKLNARIVNESKFACVHIRRGDYWRFSSHGPLSDQFYINQVWRIKDRVSKLVVHSDDILAVNNLGMLPIGVSNYSLSGNAWDLLADASQAAFFIGSNSSLSWWAAFAHDHLGKFGNAQITFPSEWYRGVPTQTLSIIPNHWELVKVDWA